MEYTQQQIDDANNELDEAKANLANGETEEAEKRIERVKAILGDPLGPVPQEA